MRLIARFTIVGTLNSAVHALFVELLHRAAPAAPGLAVLRIAWLLSIPIGYVNQAKLVCRVRLAWLGLAKLALSQVPRVVVSTGLSAIAGALGVSLFWQEVIALVSGAIVSYVLQR